MRVASDNPVVGSSLNLSGMPLLETLDVSRWTYLERIVVDATCPLLKTLDLRNMRYYKDFVGINNSAIENILLEGEYTNITNTFKFEGLSSLTTLDFSKMETEALVLFLQDISLESIKFPDTPGIFSLNMAMQITNSIVPKLDLTNVGFGTYAQAQLNNSGITEFAFDPTILKNIQVSSDDNIIVYLPDAIYDTLDGAGTLDLNGIKSHCGMTVFTSTGSGNITFAKYSTYVP